MYEKYRYNDIIYECNKLRHECGCMYDKINSLEDYLNNIDEYLNKCDLNLLSEYFLKNPDKFNKINAQMRKEKLNKISQHEEK